MMVRFLVEVYRYILMAAFALLAWLALAPIAVWLLPGHYEMDTAFNGAGVLGGIAFLALLFTTGLSLIGIAIYDRLGDIRRELEWTRAEVESLRDSRLD